MCAELTLKTVCGTKTHFNGKRKFLTLTGELFLFCGHCRLGAFSHQGGPSRLASYSCEQDNTLGLPGVRSQNGQTD